MSPEQIQKYLDDIGVKALRIGDRQWLAPWQLKERVEPLMVHLVLTPFSVMAYARTGLKATESNLPLLEFLLRANSDKCLGEFALTDDDEIILLADFPEKDLSAEELRWLLAVLPQIFDEYYLKILKLVRGPQREDVLDLLE